MRAVMFRQAKATKEMAEVLTADLEHEYGDDDGV
jgi:hypothetical protein